MTSLDTNHGDAPKCGDVGARASSVSGFGVSLLIVTIAAVFATPILGPLVPKQLLPSGPRVAEAAVAPTGCAAGRIALTFDDGPGPYTSQVVAVLKQLSIRGTFFVIGEKALVHPDVLREIVDAGSSVQNHSWSHPHIGRLDKEDVRKQIDRAQWAIMDAGVPRPTLFRAPFGEINGGVPGQAAAAGVRLAEWSIDTNDWKGRAPDQIVGAVVKNASDGAVVLMHDGLPSAVNTIAALPPLVSDLRARGYCFVSATEVPAVTSAAASRTAE
jgi:peptidoglycan/xylan/chitin deacetylase (PgdA/CDA1 family)